MNLLNCFEAYNIESIHVKYTPDGGISWLPIVNGDRLTDDTYDNTADAMCEWLDDQDIEGVEFLAGVITPDYDCDLVRCEGTVTRRLNTADCMHRLVTA